MVGGEALTKNLQQKFYAHSSGDLINMYGPSESTIYTTFSPLKVEDTITIGKPLQNIRAYVLDENRRPLLPTACGELYIAGECLAAGYVSRPDLTEAAFTDDIYFPGEKMYRTGDMVRQRVDGSYDFLGRKDDQVKLNGQRVELTEITSAIQATGLVEQAATVAVRNADDSMTLVAFYVCEGQDVEDARIREILGRVLPEYMVPSRFLRITAMPMTASNKVDLRLLQQMAVGGIPEVVSIPVELPKKAPIQVEKPNAPVKVDVSYVFSVWNRVLQVPATDSERSFFAQGGTSMAALSVLSSYYSDGYEMSLAEFYANPSAAQQATLLAGRCAAETAEPVAEPTSPVKSAAPLISGNPAGKRDGAVLITGATGFFGVHLLWELLEKEDGRPIICLMRGGEKQRLMDTLAWYFGRGYVNHVENRLCVVAGDITLPYLGMSKEAYKDLSNRIGEIFHCAADVRHYAADVESYTRTNVDGTLHMLELACSAEASFYHISTCSVGGDRVPNSGSLVKFSETDYDIGQDWESNIYVRSKFLAEGHVRQAAEAGLHVKIFRLGRLVGRMRDGVFQKNPQNNAFYLLMHGFSEIGVLPESVADVPVDLMPIDLCAREVLALTKGPDPVYHILSSNPPTLSQIAEELSEYLRIVSQETFEDVFAQKRSLMNPELLGAVMDYLYRCKYAPANIIPVNALTQQALTKLEVDSSVGPVRQILQDFFR